MVIGRDYKEFKYLCIEILVQLGKLLKNISELIGNLLPVDTCFKLGNR